MKSTFYSPSFLLDPINTSTHGEREKERYKHAKGQEEREKKKKKKREMGERDQGGDRKQASVSQEGKLHCSSDG